MIEMNHLLWQPQSRPEARLRLLCFSYAGAGANVFRNWDLGEAIEITAIQLPGREWRRDEPPLTRMEALVDSILPSVADWLDEPCPGAFFGYSMGAALSYVLAVRLQEEGIPLPDALFMAACRAPQVLARMRPIYQLDDTEFLASLRNFGGMPETVLAEPELMQLALPVLRADFEVLGTYRWRPHEPLNCPITVYGGSHDPLAPRADLAQWREHTTADFGLRLFSGGHFFINEARGQLLRTLEADLAMFEKSEWTDHVTYG